MTRPHAIPLPSAFGKDSGNNMKTRICLFSLATVVLFGATTFADGPFDRFLPRGRLLKKIRDEFAGQPQPKQPTPATKPKQAAQKGPTPAIRPNSQGRSQSSAANHQGSQHRSTAAQQADPQRPTVVKSGQDGFGMAVVLDKSENLVVAQVAAGGNAAEAGLRRGDVLVEAGGVELTSIEEFEQIAKILGAGDQLELKVARGGRTGKVMLQHGQPPTLEDVDNGNANVQADATTRSRREQRASTSNRYQDDFSFVPPADDSSGSGMQSVIELATGSARPISTQKPALSQLQSNYRPQPQRTLQQAGTQQQQQQIQALRRQLEQLRRQQSLTGSGVRAQ